MSPSIGNGRSATVHDVSHSVPPAAQPTVYRRLDARELAGLTTEQARVAREIDRLTDSAAVLIATGYSRARGWRAVHLVLSPLTAALAGVAGLTGISEIVGPVVAGAIALGAAVVAATEGALSPLGRASQARDSAEAFIRVRDDMRQFAYLRLGEMGTVDGTAHAEEFAKRIHDIGAKTDPPGVLMWRRIRQAGS